MKIVRAKRKKNFTIMSNDVIGDNRLSYRALGVLTYLLSLPDGWETDSVKLGGGRKEGRDAIRTSLAEIEAAGYLHRRKVQDPTTGHWSTVAELSDAPGTEDGFSVPGPTSEDTPLPQVAPTPGKPTVGYPDVGKPGATTKDPDQGLTARTQPGGTLPPDPLRPEHASRTRNEHEQELTLVPDYNDTRKVTNRTHAPAEYRQLPIINVIRLAECKECGMVLDPDDSCPAGPHANTAQIERYTTEVLPALAVQLSRLNHPPTGAAS